MPTIKNVIPQATTAPEAPPDPVKIDKEPTTRAKRRANPLRIDLAAGNQSGGAPASGANV